MYCRKEMVKILKCYLIPKKAMALCLRVQFFLANPVYIQYITIMLIWKSKNNHFLLR